MGQQSTGWEVLMVHTGCQRRVARWVRAQGFEVVYPLDDAGPTGPKKRLAGWAEQLVVLLSDARWDALVDSDAGAALLVHGLKAWSVVEAAPVEDLARWVAERRPPAVRLRTNPASLLHPVGDLLAAAGVRLAPAAPQRMAVLVSPMDGAPPDQLLGRAERSLRIGLDGPVHARFARRAAAYVAACDRDAADGLPRSHLKLAEIFARLALDDPAAHAELVAARTFVDVGASPGGWTVRALRDVPGARVVAVDPGAMASVPEEEMRPGGRVTYLPLTGEAALDAAAAAVGDAGADVLMMDVNVQPYVCVHLLASYAARVLRPGALVLWTLKLPRRAESRLDELAEQQAAGAARDCPALRMQHLYALFHNLNERTMVARWDADAAAAVAAAVREKIDTS